MTIAELKKEIMEIEIEMETLKITHKGMTDPFKQVEYRSAVKTCLLNLRTLKNALCDTLLLEIKSTFPKADAIYVDKIIEMVGEDGLYYLVKERKIELCGCVNGRYLYTI